MTADPLATVPREVREYLAAHSTLTLATASSSGLPHAATLVYVNEGANLYVCILPETVSARHMEENPKVSFAIDEYTPDWSAVRSLQGNGESASVDDPLDREHVLRLFEVKFAQRPDAQTADLAIVRITPTSLIFVDRSSEGESGSHTLPILGTERHERIFYNIFQDLSEGNVANLAEALETVEVGPGEVIVEQGAPADRFYIVVDGAVDVIRLDEGEERTLARLKRGQFFGEMAILRNMPRTATVRSVRPTTLLAMDRDSFRNLVGRSLTTAETFEQLVQQRLDEISRPPS